ncbi:MAG: hypothetical protein IJ417_06480 [Bacteroidaceae bacterium]|nr:hypothetical protein [Bacteroidaceae bacterium]
MMKRMLMFAFAVFAWLGAQAQESLTENPRGVYKLTRFIGKTGEIAVPYDQYKVCTDSITLVCAVEDTNRLQIAHPDKLPHNYTGKRHRNPMSRESLIYDSNDKQFTLEWWSEYSNHIYFPYKGWCTEYYQSGLYSENAKPFFDAIMKPVEVDESNEFIGTWNIIGHMDDVKGVRNIKKVLAEMQQRNFSNEYASFIFTPTYVIKVWSVSASILEKVSYKGKNRIVLSNGNVVKVFKLSKDCIAYPIPHIDGLDYVILQRDNSKQPIIGKIASFFLSGGYIVNER